MTARIAAAATCTSCRVGRTVHPSGLCGRCRRVPLGQAPAQSPSTALVAPRPAPEPRPLGDADRGAVGVLADVHAAPALSENPATLMWLGEPRIGFTVYGIPGSQGSKNKGAHGQMYESSKKVVPWRQAVASAFLAVAGRSWAPIPKDDAVVLDVVYTIHRPDGEPKTIRTFPRRNPDIDKMDRATHDGLTEAGLWVDDAQLVGHRRHWSFYAGDPDPDALNRPGAVIRAWTAPREMLT